MRKVLLFITGAWAALILILAVSLLIQTHRDVERLAGLLAFVAAAASGTAVFVVGKPSAVWRLKDQILVAQLRAERDGLRAGSVLGAQGDSRKLGNFASGAVSATIVAMAINAAVTVLAFVFIGVPKGLDKEEFMFSFLAGIVPAATLAVLWRKHDVVVLQREIREAGLTATLKALIPAATQPAAPERAKVIAPARVQATPRAATVPPPLPTQVALGGGAAADTHVTNATPSNSPTEQKSAAPKRWRIRGLFFIAFIAVIAGANAGPKKGQIVFAQGTGMILGVAAVSLPFAALLLLICRKVWKRAWSYHGAYTTHLAGGLAAVAPLFLSNALFSTSYYYPYETWVGMAVSTSIVPPLVWSQARLADGDRIGLRHAFLGAIILAPIGFTVGYAVSTWIAS